MFRVELNPDSPAAIRLLGTPVAESWDGRQARRQIARWRTRALAQAIIRQASVENARVSSGYSIELEFGFRNAGGDAPRLLSRMVSLGEPDVAKKIGDDNAKNPETRERLLALKARYAEAWEVVDEPIWRLLDPAPLSIWELGTIERFIVECYRKQGIRHITWGAYTVFTGVGTARRTVYARHDRLSLVHCLMELRSAECQGNVAAYYMALLVILDHARPEHTAASLQPLQTPFVGKRTTNPVLVEGSEVPDLASYVFRTFGLIELLDPASCENVMRACAYISSSFVQSTALIARTGKVDEASKDEFWPARYNELNGLPLPVDA